MTRRIASLACILVAASGGLARAADDQVNLSTSGEASTPPAASGAPSAEAAPVPATPPTPILPEAPPEAPPPPPRHKGFVVESRLGALGFMGQFRHVAPTAPWFYTQLGFEPIAWLMVFGYGELALTDTSEAQDETHSKAFPMFGFGGGLRVTIHVTERVAVFAQGAIGAMKADVPNGTLAFLGYRDAESLQPAFGGRIGVEWYQIDRHMALGLGVGIRDAKGFAKLGGTADTPLMFDASAALRYTF